MRANPVRAAGASHDELAAFYLDHFEYDVLPFWLKHADHRRGGVFNCIENTSGRRVSSDKFVWSQARWAWTLAHASRMAERGVLRIETEQLREQARLTADFLIEHAFLANGSVAYLLTEEGNKKEFLPGRGHDLSFFTDGFVILALTGVARATGHALYFDRAVQAYDGLRERLKSGEVRSEPYPLPSGCRAHAWPMIMLNVAQELERAATERKHSRAEAFAADALSDMETVLTSFVRDDDLVQEVRCDTSRDSLLTRHTTPGHAIESMWFVMEQALRHDRQDAVVQAAKVMLASFEAGWDSQHGGLFRFIVPGEDGPQPNGPANGPFEQLILDTWDTKIWWPHTETLYAGLLAEAATENFAHRRVHDQVYTYTFDTFPNPDPEVGEWIQIRDRQGRPLDKVVGLPVKDPYHLMRNLMFLIELLTEGIEARTTRA